MKRGEKDNKNTVEWWDEYWPYHGQYQNACRDLVCLLGALTEDKEVLDVGCSSGSEGR